MIPTMILVGFILGLIPQLQWRWLAVAVVAVSVGFAAIIAFSPDASVGDVAMAFTLALINTAVGVAIGVGIVALVRRARRRRAVQESS